MASSRVDAHQVKLAVAALANFLRDREKRREDKGEARDLFDSGDVPLQLVIALKRIPDSYSAKLHSVELPNSFRVVEDVEDGAVEACIFVKDPPREVKDVLEQEGAPAIKKVLGLSKLRAKTKSFEEKRKLCDSYDVFFADKRILPLLPKVIGKKFFDKKKQPIPVDVTRRSVAKSIDKALRSTHFTIPTGPSICVTIGSSRLSISDNTENIVSSVDKIVDKLPRKWRGVQAIHLKASNSSSLPLYTALPTASTKAQAKGKGKSEDKKSPGKGGKKASALQRVRQRVEEREQRGGGQAGESPQKRRKVASSGQAEKKAKKGKRAAAGAAAVVKGKGKKGQEQTKVVKGRGKKGGSSSSTTVRAPPSKSPLSRAPRRKK